MTVSNSQLQKVVTAKEVGAKEGKAPPKEPLGNTSTAKATAVVDVIVELLGLFGFRSESYKREGEIARWAAMFENTGDWMKTTKYKVACFYQFHQIGVDNLWDTTLPPSPFTKDFVYANQPGRLLGGTAKRFIHKYLAKGKRVREEFLSSILQLKKGMPRPDESALEASRAKTVKALTTRKLRTEKLMSAPGKHTFGPQNRIRFSAIARQVKRTTDEIFRGKKFDVLRDLLSGTIMPSLSAVNSTSRAKLGMFGWLKKNNLFSSDENYVPLSSTQKREPTRVGPIQHKVSLNLRGEFDFKASFTEPVVENESRESTQPGGRPEFVLHGMNGMRDQYVKTYFDTLRLAMNEEPTAVAVPLAEALKVRVITKGPPATQYCLKPLQRFMWRILAKHPVFELIGTPESESIVQRAMGRLQAGEAWLSGDYSDATNQLDPRLTNIVWDTMCNVCSVPEAIRQLGFRALTGHFIKDKDELLVQTWGQLMGSILSFPVLCVVNAAICRMSLEHSRDRFLQLTDCPLLVNGDDCVFPVTNAGYSFWGAAGEMAGLSPSVGKVYYSPHFLNIDSQNFQYRTGSGVDSYFNFKKTKCVNLGLLKGLKRSALSEEDNDGGFCEYETLVADGWDSLGSRHTTLMDTCPSYTLRAVHKAFIAYNWEKLMPEGKSCGLPWYVPKCYGGLGMKPMKMLGAQHTFSELDARIVTAMVLQSDWLRPGERERLCKVLRPKSATKIHAVAMELLREALPAALPTRWVLDDSDEEDGLDVPEIDLFVVYLYPELVEADEEMGDSAARTTILHNKRTWSWFQKNVSRFGYLEPFKEMKARRLITEVNVITD